MSASFFGETGPVDILKRYLPRETRPVIIFEVVRPMPSPIGVISVTPTTSAENTGKGRVRTEAAQNGAAAGHSNYTDWHETVRVPRIPQRSGDLTISARPEGVSGSLHRRCGGTVRPKECA